MPKLGRRVSIFFNVFFFFLSSRVIVCNILNLLFPRVFLFECVKVD